MPDISVTFSIVDNASSNLLKITQKNNDLHQSFIKTVQTSNSFNDAFKNTIQTTNNLANKINLAHNQLQPFNNLLYSTGTSAGNLINPLTSATASMNSFTSALSAANAKMMDFENQSTSVTKPLATILMNISQPTRAMNPRKPKQPEQPTSMMSKIISPFSTAISEFIPSVLPYAAAYISIQTAKEGIKQMVETTNDLTLAKARLNTIGLSIDEVAQSAMRARTPLFDMVDSLNLINTGAGHLFKNNDELIKFTETLNKQMIASGVEPERQKNALVQISQAMSLGVLRGQDFKTVMQDTPAIIKNLADYLGVAQNEVKGLADQGAISAEIFKNAVLSSTAEVDKKLQDIPMTYAQVWTNFKTQVTQALAPFLENIRKSIVETGNLTNALTFVANSLILIGNAADIAFNIVSGCINSCLVLLELFAGLLTKIIGDLAWIFTFGHFDKLKNLGDSMVSDGVSRIFDGGAQVKKGLSKIPVLFDPKTYYRYENGELLMPGELSLRDEYNNYLKTFQNNFIGQGVKPPTYEEWFSGKQALQEQKEKIEAEAREAERKRQQEEIKKMLQTPPPTFNTGRTGQIGSGTSRNIGRIASNTDAIAKNTKTLEESIKRLAELNMRTVVNRAPVTVTMSINQNFNGNLNPTGVQKSADDILEKINEALEESRSLSGMAVAY